MGCIVVKTSSYKPVLLEFPDAAPLIGQTEMIPSAQKGKRNLPQIKSNGLRFQMMVMFLFYLFQDDSEPEPKLP